MPGESYAATRLGLFAGAWTHGLRHGLLSYAATRLGGSEGDWTQGLCHALLSSPLRGWVRLCSVTARLFPPSSRSASANSNCTRGLLRTTSRPWNSTIRPGPFRPPGLRRDRGAQFLDELAGSRFALLDQLGHFVGADDLDAVQVRDRRDVDDAVPYGEIQRLGLAVGQFEYPLQQHIARQSFGLKRD